MLKSKIILAATFAAILSRGAADGSAPRNDYFPRWFAKVDPKCADIESGKPAPVLTELENGWYSAQLVAAREPSLYVQSARHTTGAGTTLRFTWLRSFHAPIIVRVEGLGSKHPWIIAKKLSGKGGYAPGTVSQRLVRPLSQKEQRALQTALIDTNVLSMSPKPCYRETSGTRMIELDGAEWIIEAVDAKGYHFINRWSPECGGVHDLGLVLLSMTGWAVKPVY